MNVCGRWSPVAALWLALALLAPLPLNAQTQGAPKREKPTIVIVHGAWGGSWAWRRVDELLTERGFKVYRPQLTGEGERVHLQRADVGLETHIEDVANTLLYEDLHDVVLVGHSYGGMVITGVAQRIPERIKRLVYVDAFVPGDGESMFDLLTQANRDQLAAMKKGDFLVPTWASGKPPPRDEPQSFKTITDPIALGNKAAAAIPGTYILTVAKGTRAEDDEFYPQSLRAKSRGWPVQTIISDHNPEWSAPEEVAYLLSQAAGK